MKKGKRYAELTKLVDRTNNYDPQEAVALVKKLANAKFDETIEAHIRLGVDGRQADQQIRGAVVLPHGTGKEVKVLVFAKDAKAEEAKAAGAEFVGAEELIPKIQKENWYDFDVVVATPDMMGVVGRLGRDLGPKGLMPNPKAGTVTMDVANAIKEIKAGKVQPVAAAKRTVLRIFDAHRALCDPRACQKGVVHARKKICIHNIVRVKDAEGVVVFSEQRLKRFVQRVALAADLAARL